MVAPGGQRGDAVGAQVTVEGGDSRHAVGDIGRVGADIAQVGAVCQFEGAHAGGAIFGADHGGGVAQLARSVARAGAVGGAAVPGHADQADLHIAVAGVVRGQDGQAHEAGNTCEAGQVHARDRLKEGIGHGAS